MIAKKNSRYDLERKRIVLFQVGILVAGSFTLAAFSYSNDVLIEKEKDRVAYQPIDFQTEFEEQPEPERDVVQQNNQQQSSQQYSLDQTDPLDNLSAVQNTGDIPVPAFDLPPVLPPGDGIGSGFVDVDGGDIEEFPPTEAKYKGGYIAMQSFIDTTLNYPQVDIEFENQGIVYVSFVVEKDGSISNVSVERGVSKTIDREAKRVVRSFPTWVPAENAYGKVRSRVRLPLKFLLE